MSVPTCDYAACTRRSTHDDSSPDGTAFWSFCPQHWREHRADLHGEPWPTLRPVNVSALIGLAGRGGGPEITQPHGTPAARRRHQRRGEGLCDTCKASLRRQAYPDARRLQRHAS